MIWQPATSRVRTAFPIAKDRQPLDQCRGLKSIALGLQAISLRVAIRNPNPRHDSALYAEISPAFPVHHNYPQPTVAFNEETGELSTQFSYAWLHLMFLAREICRFYFDQEHQEMLEQAFKMLAQSISENCPAIGNEAVRLVLETIEPDSQERQAVLDWYHSGQEQEYQDDNKLGSLRSISRHTIILHGLIMAMQNLINNQP